MSLGALIFLSLALGLAAWLFFLWTVRTGQYDDPEGPKYRMLEEDEEEGGAGGKKEGTERADRTAGEGKPGGRDDGVPPEEP